MAANRPPLFGLNTKGGKMCEISQLGTRQGLTATATTKTTATATATTTGITAAVTPD